MTTLAQHITYWEDVEARLRRKVYHVKGSPLSMEDTRTIAAAFAMGGCLLVDLQKRHGLLGGKREYVAWCHHVAALDMSTFAAFLSDVVVVLRGVTKATTWSWFKRQLQAYPVGLLTLPVRRVLEEYLHYPNPTDFLALSQFYSFFTHINLKSLKHDLENEYVEFEERLHELQYPPDLIHELNEIMTEWLSEFSIREPFVPSHGPGATSHLQRGAFISDKYRDLFSDRLLDYVVSKVTDDVSSFFPYGHTHGLHREAKLLFVPKSMKTYRVISKEPTSLMYFQKGVKDQLYPYIEDKLFGHVNFARQELNADLALEGSKYQSFGTIDLSSASDSVTWTLVKSLFRNTPLYPWLLATRSRSVRLPSGQVIAVEKFAPMGSALCFPIQTLVFSAVVESARRHIRPYDTRVRWRVYGDDIIVPTHLYDDVVARLSRLHFCVNQTKSYSFPSRFRESCGMEAYDGFDVTPLRISRRFIAVDKGSLRFHPEQYEGLQDMANQAYSAGLTVLRAYILRRIFDGGALIPLFAYEGEGALHSDVPDNYRAIHACLIEWDVSRPSYQRAWVRVDTVTTSTPQEREIEDDDVGRLYEFLRLSLNRDGDELHDDYRIDVPRGASRTRLRRTWVLDPRESEYGV